MSHIDEIEKAIAAHATWKVRLRRIITEGKTSLSADEIRADSRCDLGRWLQGPGASFDPAKRAEIMKLHTAFHKAAAKVAELALHGRTKEAEAMMGTGGEYGVASSELACAMIAWKKKVAA